MRDAVTVEGHAVRQLYLLAAVADLAVETGEEALRTAAERQWSAMAATKTHLTGGVGAHHDEEDFGDPYELPNERAYCETCAAIASIQWSWRMALLTGEARYSDLIERTLFNGFLSGVSLDGLTWLYVNPLQVRDGHIDPGGDHSARRTRWFRCACCPPNVMRLLASLDHYVSSTDGRGLHLHQYATGEFRGQVSEVGDVGDTTGAGGEAVVGVTTDYPWAGRVTVNILAAPAAQDWTLSLRIPQRCTGFTVEYADRVEDETSASARDGWLRLTRRWTPGEQVILDLGLKPRVIQADLRVDAVRGCVAIEYGPLVYCVEQVDHPGGGLDDVVLDLSRPLVVKERPDLLGGVTTVLASGYRRAAPTKQWWPYKAVADDNAERDKLRRTGRTDRYPLLRLGQP